MTASRWRIKLAVLSASLVLALAIPEVLLRLRESRYQGPTLESETAGVPLPAPGSESRWLHALRPVANERIGYALRPGFDAYVTMAQERSRLTVNEHGFRGPSTTLDKPAGTIRIVGIGDSVMMGFGLEYEQTYLRLLERKFAERHPELRVEVLNLAVGGYNAVQELETLRVLGRRLGPDLVLWHAVCNDHHGIQYRAWEPNFWNPRRWFLAEWFGELREPAAKGRFHGWSHVERAIGRLAAMQRREGFELLLYGHEVNQDAQRVLDISRAAGIDTVDFTEFLPSYSARGIHRQDLLIPNDGHPSALHNELIAEDLYRLLIERGLVERWARRSAQ